MCAAVAVIANYHQQQEMRSEFFMSYESGVDVVMSEAGTSPSSSSSSSSDISTAASTAVISCLGGDVSSATHHAGTNHMNKGKAQRDRRKLREKRRSTGVVHLPSTESTGGSTGEDDDEEVVANEKETRKNTQHNEFAAESTSHPKPSQDRGNLKHQQQTSASDLEADDEENGGSGSPSSANNDELPSPRLTENGAASAVVGASRSATEDSSKPTDIISLLEKTLEENQKLTKLLESRNREIAALEAAVRQLNGQLGQVGSEVSRLKEENATLIKAMGSLTSN